MHNEKMSQFDPIPQTGRAHDRLVRHQDRCVRCRDRRAWAFRAWKLLSKRDPDPAVDADIYYAAALTPLGLMWVAQSASGVTDTAFDEDELWFRHHLSYSGVSSYDPARFAPFFRALESYFEGGPWPSLPIDLGSRSSFAASVLRTVHEIPPGEMRSYGTVADTVGRPRAARAVGTVMANSPISIVIPCHRVVRGDGKPGIYGTHTAEKCGLEHRLFLLALEGIALSERDGKLLTSSEQ